MGSGGAHLPCGPRQVTNPPEPTSRSPGGAPDPQPTPRPRKGSENKRTASALASPGGERAGAGRSGQTGVSVLVQRLLPGADSVSSPPNTPSTRSLHQPRTWNHRAHRAPAPGASRGRPVAQGPRLCPLVPAGGSNSGPRPADPAGLPAQRDRKRHTLLRGPSQTRRPGKGGLVCPSSLHPDPEADPGDQADPCEQVLEGNCASRADGAWAEQPPHSPRAELGYAPNARGSPRCSLKATCHVLASPGAGTPCLESRRKL